MKRKVAKYAACCLAAGLVLFTGTDVFAVDNNLAAGLSFSFGGLTGLTATITADKPEEVKDNTESKDSTESTESKESAESKDSEQPSKAEAESATENNIVAAGVTASMTETTISNKEVQKITAPKSEFTDLAIAQVNDYVNIRSSAGEEGEVLGKLYNNSAAVVLEEEDDWYKIKSGNVEGFVKSEFVVRDDPELAEKVRTRLATVTTETLRVRKDASTDAGILDLIPEGDVLIVKDETIEGWVGVVVGEKVGYVSTEFVDVSSKYVQAESKEEEAARLKKEADAKKAAAAAAAAAQQRAAAQRAAQQAANNNTKKSNNSNNTVQAASGGSGSAVANYALQFVGNPYVYGGSSLTNGTDCSGFVMSVYSAFGVGLPHQSGAQRGCGYGVSVSEAQPGDVMCYSGHVGIYIGNGQMVHASTPSTGIVVSDIGSPIAVRRMIG